MGSSDLMEQAGPYSLLRSQVKNSVAWVRHRWAFFLLAAFILFVISAFTPYLVSAFYLELGGRELDRIPIPNPQSPIPSPSLANPDSGHLAVAIAHLQRAIAWDGHNAQAHRLLGQAYLAQEDHLAAIEALTTYTDLRPDNPLGHLELAQVYERLARASKPPEVYYDFIEHLPEAAVTTPSAPIQTDYCVPSGPVASCYVAPTYWTMPDDVLRPVLFMHPSSWARYVVTVPVEATMLRFSVGMYPPSWDWGGDGATFEVCIQQDGAEEKRLFSTHVSNTEEDWGWHEGEVDLTPYAGQVVTLTLGTHPGLQGDPTGDWAGWAEPRLEGVDALQRRVEAEKWWAKAVAEWQAAGLAAQDFITQGEEAHKVQHYEEALGWYNHALLLEPDLAQAWLGKALVCQAQGQWDQAAEYFGMAFSRDSSLKPQLVLPGNEEQSLSLESFTSLDGQSALLTEWQERQVIIFFSNYTATATIFVEEAGFYQGQILAVNSQPGPVELAIGVDDAPLELLYYAQNDWSWEEKSFCLKLPVGFHHFTIAFTNDSFTDSDLDRNALVGGIRFLPSRESSPWCD